MDKFNGQYVPEDAPEFAGNYYRTLGDVAKWQGKFDEEIIDPDMPIVDCHIHLQEDARGRYLYQDFLADAHAGHNIVSTVHVQAKSMLRAGGPEKFRDVGETEFARGIAAMSASGYYGKPSMCDAIVGFADLCLGDDVSEVIDAHEEAAGGRLRGFRQIAPWVSGELGKSMPLNAPEGLLMADDFRKGFAKLGPRNLSFEAWAFHPQMSEVADLARAFPDTKIIVNHMGGRLGIGRFANQLDEVWQDWTASMAELAKLENVYLKVGGLGMLYGGFDFHTRKNPPTSEQLASAWGPFLQAGIEAFGPDKCLTESNFPIDSQTCSYPVMWNTLKRVTAAYSKSERNALFHGTAIKAYRLPPIDGV